MKKLFKILIILIVLAAAAAAVYWFFFRKSPEAAPKMEFKIDTVARGNVRRTISATAAVAVSA